MTTTAIDRTRLREVHARERARFEERTRRSAALTARARPLMPDGVPMAWMAGLYDHGPVHVAHGEGCRFTDVDGNTYIDFNQADLAASCGFAPPRRGRGDRRARRARHAVPAPGRGGDRGGASCSPTATTCPAGSSRCRRPAPTPRRSGSPVTAPGGRSIVVFGGHYHGHLDDTLVTGDERHGAPGLLGLNPRAAADTRLVPFNDLDALERVLAAEDVAAVVTEPALTNVGVVLPDDGFLAGVRAATRAHGTLLVLDETHTQTVAYGGLTRAWGLEPDVVTLGKSLGGGMPVGAYGMTAELRDHLEEYRDAFGRVTGIATGGTTYANPLSLAAVVATLTHVQTPEALRPGAHARRPARRRHRGAGPRARAAVARAPARRAAPGSASSRSCRATPTRRRARSTPRWSTPGASTSPTAASGTRSPAPGRPPRSPTRRRTSTPIRRRSAGSSTTWSGSRCG